jgi:hypothetical protein
MDRRGHAMPGMDAVYNHITLEMRQRLCDVLEQLWHQATTQRCEIAPTSAVPILNEILSQHSRQESAHQAGPPGALAVGQRPRYISGRGNPVSLTAAEAGQE